MSRDSYHKTPPRLCRYYADVIFDKPSNAAFSNPIESVRCNTALVVTGTIRGTSKEKL